MKLFISIASYRDPLLENTVIDAYNNATYKDSLVFSVVDQGFLNETICLDRIPFKKQIRYLRIDPHYARGACWARNLAQSMYDGENYYFQIDSHSMFDLGWDERFIKQFSELRQYHSKPIITAYPHSFGIDNFENKKFSKTKYDGILALTPDLPECFVGGEYYVSTHSIVLGKSMPVHGSLISANCFFSSGAIVEDVPYDPFLFFSGEEHSLAVRYWTSGYNIFHIPDIPVYTNYSRDYRLVIWGDQSSQDQASIKWWEYDQKSKNRLKNIVTGVNTGKYGLGTVRSLENYKKWSGIDYQNRTINPVSIFDLDYRSPITF